MGIVKVTFMYSDSTVIDFLISSTDTSVDE